MNENIETNVQKLTPFTKILMTIGNLPTSYLMSMTYYEQLIWFTKYLQEQVIPAVNTNASAVEEIQQVVIELENYVNNYFDNLDVQEEINNKLDEMARNGSLTNLIKNYVDPLIDVQDVKINTNTNDIAVLKSRVDGIEQLPEGSTSGDAELIGIRTAYNGEVYETAGDSVRAQVEGIYNNIGSKMELKNPINWWNTNKLVNSKYVNLEGNEYENTEYRYLTMKVTPGDVLRFYRFYDNNRYGEYPARFVCAYVNGVADETLGVENVNSFTIPTNVNSVSISIKTENTKPCITINNIYKPTGEQTYFDPYYIATNKFNNKAIQINNTNGKLEIKGSNLANNQVATLPKNNIVKNKNLIINATFNEFNQIDIRRQQDTYVYNTIKIDSNKLYIENPINGYNYEVNHGLTIENDITVLVESKKYDETNQSQTTNYDYRVIISSNGSRFVSDYFSINSPQSYEDLSLISRGMTLLTYYIALTSEDFKKNIYVFGDSYLSLYNARWTYYLGRDGYLNKVLLNGFPGENSYRAYLSFNNIKNLGKPKYMLWLMGMNDPDTNNTINPNWQSYLNEFIKFCDENDITPILATIPNTPINNNTYKNYFVRNSGYRYIEFADAVQTQRDATTWKTGMLAQDEIHPTEKGAIALYCQLLKDFPEITE